MNKRASFLGLLALSTAATFSIEAATTTYSAPVQVTNPDTAPVPTRDVDKHSHIPYVFVYTLAVNNGPQKFVLPAGKRLVIESVSAFAYMNSPIQASGVTLTVFFSPAPSDYYSYSFPLADEGDHYTYSFRQSSKLYVDAFFFTLSHTDPNIRFGNVVINGYLEDASPSTIISKPAPESGGPGS